MAVVVGDLTCYLRTRDPRLATSMRGLPFLSNVLCALSDCKILSGKPNMTATSYHNTQNDMQLKRSVGGRTERVDTST